ncbi:hypothetical protein Tco_0108234, partial [Tanacetum coccineum]
MHAVPPPMTGNYMPSGPEIEVDYSQFTYGPKQTQPSESESQSSEFDTCESNISTEPSELVSEPVVNESNVECQPKVWSKIINNVRHITTKVAGKPVSISEASIRSDLLFNDANGIDSLPNQTIFDAIQLMG